MQNLIELHDVCLTFGSDFAISNLTFEVKETEIFGFLGPSGAGKTTTIKLLTQQLISNSGNITLFGTDMEKSTRYDFDKIGILSDTSNLYDRFSIEDNLKFYADIRGCSYRAVEDVLRRVALYDQRKQKFSKCSKGMKQRAILAAAVLHRPKLLFLDEPTSGLDPATSLEIHKLLLDLNREGATIFLTTHNMEEADKLCNRVGILNQGRLIACGTPQDLKLKFAKEEIKVLKENKETVTLPKNTEGVQILLDMMKKKECLTIHSQEPNLEEIFLQLTGREF